MSQEIETVEQVVVISTTVLKSLVKELAQNLDLMLPTGCRVIKCKNCKSRCGRKDRIELISKAREACK